MSALGTDAARAMALAHGRSVNATISPEIRLVTTVATTSAASATLTSSDERIFVVNAGGQR